VNVAPGASTGEAGAQAILSVSNNNPVFEIIAGFNTPYSTIQLSFGCIIG